MALQAHILEQPSGLVYGALMAFRAGSAGPAGIAPSDVGVEAYRPRKTFRIRSRKLLNASGFTRKSFAPNVRAARIIGSSEQELIITKGMFSSKACFLGLESAPRHLAIGRYLSGYRSTCLLVYHQSKVVALLRGAGTHWRSKSPHVWR